LTINKLNGLIAAPFTPFKENGTLNLKQIKPLARLYRQNGVKGVFIAGTTGEGPSLSHKEKKILLQTWAAEKESGLKMIFTLGGTCIEEMQELAQMAKTHQMDAVSILCPYYFRPPSLSDLVAFCKIIADTVPDIPFYYYHIPSLTHGNYSMLEFLKQAEGIIPNLAGIKYSYYDLFDFQSCAAYKEGKYNLLWGTDEALLSGLVAGADGAVGSTYNYAAPLYTKIIEAFNEGEIKKARKLQLKAVQMVQLLMKYGGAGAGKAFMKLIKADCGWFRPPLRPLTEEKLEELRKDCEAIGFYDYCSRKIQ